MGYMMTVHPWETWIFLCQIWLCESLSHFFPFYFLIPKPLANKQRSLPWLLVRDLGVLSANPQKAILSISDNLLAHEFFLLLFGCWYTVPVRLFTSVFSAPSTRPTLLAVLIVSSLMLLLNIIVSNIDTFWAVELWKMFAFASANCK